MFVALKAKHVGFSRTMKDCIYCYIFFIFTLVFWISTNTYKRFMKTKFKQWCSTIPTISTKRTVNSHFKPLKVVVFHATFNNISVIMSCHLLGHAIKSVTCFDLQFSRSTRPMTSFCIFIAYIHTEGILLNFKITWWD